MPLLISCAGFLHAVSDMREAVRLVHAVLLIFLDLISRLVGEAYHTIELMRRLLVRFELILKRRYLITAQISSRIHLMMMVRTNRPMVSKFTECQEVFDRRNLCTVHVALASVCEMIVCIYPLLEAGFMEEGSSLVTKRITACARQCPILARLFNIEVFWLDVPVEADRKKASRRLGHVSVHQLFNAREQLALVETICLPMIERCLNEGIEVYIPVVARLVELFNPEQLQVLGMLAVSPTLGLADRARNGAEARGAKSCVAS